MLEVLKRRIERIGPVSDDLWTEIKEHANLKSIRKNEVLISYGSLCKNVYMVASGSLMTSLILANGDSKAIWFSFDEHFWAVSSLDSFFLDEPSKYETVAMESTTVIEVHKQKLDAWIEKYPVLNACFREDITHDFVAINEMRNYGLVHPPAKYLAYIKEKYPFIFTRVPAKYIAQFLGITPEWYSKLLRKS